MEIISPTALRKDLYNILKKINKTKDSNPLHVYSAKSKDTEVVIISMDTWKNIQKELDRRGE